MEDFGNVQEANNVAVFIADWLKGTEIRYSKRICANIPDA
jgi:hypothetical protein